MATEHANHKAAWDDVNVRSIALVGGVGAVLVVVSVIAVQVVYFRYQDLEDLRKVQSVPFASAEAELARQRERISVAGEGAITENGEKSIPIAEAMQMVVAEYQSRQGEETDSAATE